MEFQYNDNVWNLHVIEKGGRFYVRNVDISSDGIDYFDMIIYGLKKKPYVRMFGIFCFKWYLTDDLIEELAQFNGGIEDETI